MKERPLRTTVIGSYPFPSWLEHASAHLDAFGPDDIAEIQDDAVVAALGDQMRAGLDVVTDGEWRRASYIGVIAELAHGFEVGLNPQDGRPWTVVTGELVEKDCLLYTSDAADE